MTLIQKGTLGEVVLPNSSSGKHLVKFLYSSPSLGGYGTISQIEVLPSWIEPANAQPANQKPVEPSNTWTPEKHEKIVTTKDLSLQPADADHFRTVPTINLPKGTQGYVILPDSPKGKHFVQLFSTPNDRGECAELGRFDIDHSDLSPLHPKPPLGDLTHAKTYAQDILSGESDYSPTPDWNNSNLATAFLNLLHRKPQKKTVSCYVCGGIGRITTKEAIRNHTRETEHCKERGGRGFTPANNPETQDAPNQTASLDASRCPHGNQPQYREICQLRSDLLLSRLQWNALETIVTLNFPQYAEEIISKAIKRARENHSKEEASNRRNDAMPTPTKEEKFVCPTEAKLHP